eukprot:CAMPEP_0170537584 /NCGR_PEP_ID=MMETSP0209-20121228/102804_1 /TAXON_ID=665100 ORGANISM="Litonotus pictus, Strain P1" /NCGR_SAMPLE_ID=MMETSP0209 /ASSEMBLY_ACC=CAM_ASM_000301 /LENGTH=310 /DNA_ID=CAMNT_0010839111 /DNA_START=483 /DNA_END=1412 /DNA_ORIENTATION=+
MLLRKNDLLDTEIGEDKESGFNLLNTEPSSSFNKNGFNHNEDVSNEFGEEKFISNYHEIARGNQEKILIVLHGVLGGTESPQLKDIIIYNSQIENRFFDQIICINNKGINDTPLSQPKPYYAGSYEDTKEIIDHVIETHPNCQIYLMGISMGALIFSLLLIHYPDIKNIVAFSSVSNPFSLKYSHACFTYIEAKFMIYILQNRMLSQPILQTKFSYDKTIGINNIKKFDEEFTVNIHNHSSLEDYLEMTSISSRIAQIKYYSLFINAEDDKLSPINRIDQNQFQENKYTSLIKTTYGFHVTFWEGILPKR